MPLYEYRCKKCGHHFEKIQSYSAPDAKECPVCKGQVERLISAPSFRFKGSGWYATDYAAKGGSAFDPAPHNSAGGNSAAPSAESKSAASTQSSTPAASAAAKGE